MDSADCDLEPVVRSVLVSPVTGSQPDEFLNHPSLLGLSASDLR